MRAAGGPPPPPRGRVPPPGAAPAPGEGVPSPRDPNHAKRSRAAPSQSPNRELAKPKERTLLIHALSSRFRRRRRVPPAARFGSTSIQGSSTPRAHAEAVVVRLPFQIRRTGRTHRGESGYTTDSAIDERGRGIGAGGNRPARSARAEALGAWNSRGAAGAGAER